MEEALNHINKKLETIKQEDFIYTWTDKDVEAVENLIARYKELEFKYQARKDRTKQLIKNDYIPKSKVKEKMLKYEWAIKHYDCNEADYKQSQDVGSWNVLRQLLED